MFVKHNTNAGGSRESSRREGRGEGSLVWGRNEDGLVLGDDKENPSRARVSCVESEHRAQEERMSHEYR